MGTCACNGAVANFDVNRRRARRSGAVGSAAATATGAAAPTPARVFAIDALRGLAILAMVIYHFCFDLRYFGVTHWDFYHDPVWLNARTIILSSFLLIAGVSLVLADRGRPSPARFWRHVGIIGACAMVVSAASYVLFPASWIWFGVLHAIAISLVLARPLARRSLLALFIGAGVIAAGNLFTHPAFDSRALGWLGFMTAKPRTEDYVPLFPWTGVLLLGIAAGHALVRAAFRPIALAESWPRWMAWLGRHSLATYMVHQPVLIGLLFLVVGR
jgi:uncharacterized membrane protein